MMWATFANWYAYGNLLVMVILVNLVFHGTRHDDWKSIIRNAVWGMLYILSFLGFVFVLLFCLSTLIPMWTE
jgi:hypothetical protein